MPSAGSVSVKLDMPYYINTSYWRMNLMNSADSSVLQTKDFGSGNTSLTSGMKSESSDKITLSAGRYYVNITSVDAYNIVATAYQITINLSADTITGDTYEKEPNDTTQTANNLNLNSAVTGNMSSKSDIDYYKMTLPAPGAANISFSVSSAVDSGNWVVLVYDANDKQLQMSRVGFGGAISNLTRTNQLDKLRLPAGDYYIKIVPYSDALWSSADYKISAAYAAEPGIRYEKEFNDTVETANTILINAPVTGNLNGSGDYDYYQFAVTDYQDLTIEFSSLDSVSQNSWTVYLFNGKGGINTYIVGQVGTSVNGVRTFVSDMIHLEPGTYYILVYVYPLGTSSYPNADYTLSVHSDEAPIPSITDETYIDYPTAVPPAAYGVNTALQGYIKNQTDINNFDFGLNYSGAITVTFKSPATVVAQSWILNILDKNNKLLYSDKCGGEDTDSTGMRTKTSDKIRVPAGSYYVQILPIDAYDYSTSYYNLTINYTPEAKEAINSSAELYETEYNNTSYTANTLNINQSLTGNMSDYNDIDYYKLSVNSSGSLIIYLSTPKTVTSNDWIVELFSNDLSSSASALYNSVFGADGTSAVNYAGSLNYITAASPSLRLAKGTYYIKVRAYNNIHFSNEDYKILIAFTAENASGSATSASASGASGLYETEFNDTPQMANYLPLNTDIKGNTSSAADLDYYQLSANTAKDVQIKFTVDSSINTDLWAIKVYDSTNKELKSYKIGSAGGVLIPSSNLKYFKTDKISLTPGIYYVCISSYNKTDFSNAQYTLKVLDEVGQKIDTYAYIADKPSDWAVSEVMFAYGYGLIPPSYMQNFTSPIKREEFCILVTQFLEVAENKPIDEILAVQNKKINPNVFTDTNDTYILAANALGIVNGRGNGIFDPNGNITREEAATMLMRLGQIENISINITPLTFNDSNKFNTWSATAISYVSSCVDSDGNRVMNGYTDNGFHPSDSYSREQAFMTVFRLFSIKMGL